MDMKPVAAVYKVGRGTCTISGKEGDGAVVTIANSPIKEKFLSRRKLWEMLKLFSEEPKEEK